MKPRSQALETAALREFDLAIIGGGIVGAGIAQDAASRGLSVVLLEKDDFASGTSSKTTKLIHGGLLYLEQMQIKLARELCRERSMLEQLAPHMVRNFSFILPITKSSRVFGMKAQMGLTIHEILAYSGSKNNRHQKINQREVMESAPALASNLIVGGLRFHDCITDDARLVLEVLKSSVSESASVINYVEVTGFQTDSNRVVALECRDRYSGAEMVVRCKSCVNATGVWSDALLNKLDPDWPPGSKPVKRIHIVVPPSSFETNTSLFLPTGDGRYVFVVPWHRSVMIGTTSTLYDGDLDKPLPTSFEIDYLLEIVNRYCGKNKLTKEDVKASWAGLWPADSSKDENGKTAKKSAEHQIIEAPSGVIGVRGGQLTNYRLIASQVMERVVKQFPGDASAFRQSKTGRLMLGGWLDRDDFLTQTAEIAAKARRVLIEPATLDHLIASYGKDALQIVDIVENKPSLNVRICPDFPNIMAEVAFCVLNEMAVSLEDLLFRRMRLGMLHQIQCLEAAPRVGQLMGTLLSWDDARMTLELRTLEKNLNEHLKSFSPVPLLVDE